MFSNRLPPPSGDAFIEGFHPKFLVQKVTSQMSGQNLVKYFYNYVEDSRPGKKDRHTMCPRDVCNPAE